MDKNTKDVKFTVYGYKFIDYSIVHNNNFKQCLSLLPELSRYKTTPINKKEIPLVSLNILNMHLNDVNRFINIIEKDKVEELYKEILPDDGDTLKLFISSLNDNMKYKDVYSLPIIYSDGNSLDGKINKPIIYTDNLSVLENYNLVFSSIELGSNIDYLSPTTHIHEVMHALLERNKGSVNNYLNGEVLSIFMEKVAANDICRGDTLLKISENNRLRDLKDARDSLESDKYYMPNDSEKFQYLYSGFLAEYLFTIYKDGNSFIKKQIFRNIKKVLEGDLVLEDFLNQMDVNYNNDDVPKSLLKVIDGCTIK